MRTVGLRSAVALIVLGVTGLALPAAALAAVTAGTNIGNATPLTGTAAGSITSGSDDWWVIYPSAPGQTVSVTVTNNAAPSASCSGIAASLDGTDGTRQVLNSTNLNPGTSTSWTESSGSDRYFVEVTPWGCTSNTSYTLTLTAGGGGTPPSPATGSIAAGTSIGSAWPPLQGGTSYAGSLASASSDNWYILFKRPDSNQATIRVQDTTVAGSTTCPSISVALYNSDGTRGTLSTPTLPDNGAYTFTVPGSETDPQGRYYLEIQGTSGCPAGGATYTIEPETSGEWSNPAKLASQRLPSWSTKTLAGGPLAANVAYSASLAKATTQAWTFFRANGSAPVTARVETPPAARTTASRSTSCCKTPVAPPCTPPSSGTTRPPARQ
jgi:hypothetical protein